MDRGCAWWRWCTIRWRWKPDWRPTAAAALAASERTALAATRGVVVTSPATAARLGRLRRQPPTGLPSSSRGSIGRRGPGGPALPMPRRTSSCCAWRRSCHARATCCCSRRWRGSADLPWRLTCVGSPELDPDAAARVHARVDELWPRQPGHVHRRGDRRRPRSRVRSGRRVRAARPTTRATAWPWPRRWRADLPVVCSDTGAAAALVGADSGVIVPPGDVEALTAALARVIGDDGSARPWPAARRPGPPRSGPGRRPRPFSRRRCWAPAVESFSADWLALREPADTAARSESLTRLAGQRLGERDRVRAIDLACGTGANVRYLASRLPMPADWTIVDHDRALLDEARRRLRHGALGDDFTLTAQGRSISRSSMRRSSTASSWSRRRRCSIWCRRRGSNRWPRRAARPAPWSCWR